MVKNLTLGTLFLLLTATTLSAQTPRVITRRQTVYNGDTLLVAKVATVPIFRPGRRGDNALKRYRRLINAVRVTYPIAQEASRRLAQMERDLENIPKNADRKEYIKNIEKELKREYTPILKRMSVYQGRVLLKLIDRQTGDTSYELVKELRGAFAAFFWQNIARIFGANLKTEYDAATEDALLEGIIQLYEEGLL